MARKSNKKKEEEPMGVSFSIGHRDDDFEYLQLLCKEHMEDLINAFTHLEAGKTIPVPFWTGGYIAELIGVGYIKKNADNKYEYTLNFDESTL